MEIAPFKYNPGVLGDEHLVRSFVVRHKCLDLILEMLRENAATPSSNRHLLVVGPRGIGKTMLVRRVAAEVRSNPDYRLGWIPVVYGEESYQVSSAGEFWLEALFQFSEHQPGPKFDRTLDELRAERDDSRLRERALGQLLELAEKQGKRLLFIVENLNMLCEEQITSDAAWKLRHTLLNEPRIMLLGTATSRFDAIDRADQAWFDLFAVHNLQPLERKECHTLWRSVANQDLKTGHLRAIRILTGGNPRLLTVLAGFAAKRSFRELMEQLVHLIDDHTEYFKGHLDALPSKERKVFVALLEQWNPVTAADLARATRMTVNEVSALLNRLVTRGAVELFENRPRRKLYQAAERLYNIYYLMRRRGEPADRVRAAVSFMVMFYGDKELATNIADLAREACSLPAGESADHYLAFGELVNRVPHTIASKALDQTPLEFFFRVDAPAFIRKLSKRSEVVEIIDRVTNFLLRQAWTEAAEAARQMTERFPTSSIGWAVSAVALAQAGLLEESKEAFRKSIQCGPSLAVEWCVLGTSYWSCDRVTEAEEAFRKAIALEPGEPNYRHALIEMLIIRNRNDEAELECRSAIDVGPNHAGLQEDLGIVLSRGDNVGDAEQAYRKSIELEPKSASTYRHLGNLLEAQKRHEEAKQAYQMAVELDTAQSENWNALCNLVVKVGPIEEAEKLLQEALRLNPNLPSCAMRLLAGRLRRGVTSDLILREAEVLVQRAKRSAGMLGCMSCFVIIENLNEGLPQAEAWAKECISKDRIGVEAFSLVLAYAVQERWPEALEASRLMLDKISDFKLVQEHVTRFSIIAAAAGFARETLAILTASKAATVLEPLIVGLRIYVGEVPQVAKEILEIGQDVAEKIRETKNRLIVSPRPSPAPPPVLPGSGPC